MIPNASDAAPKIIAALAEPRVAIAMLRVVYRQVMNQATADSATTDTQVVVALAMLLVRS